MFGIAPHSCQKAIPPERLKSNGLKWAVVEKVGSAVQHTSRANRSVLLISTPVIWHEFSVFVCIAPRSASALAVDW